MHYITDYFILFVFYSFFGWVLEVGLAFSKEHKFINRGFLIGPVVPIWGFGALLISFILKDSDGIFNLLVSSAFIGTALEYVINYIMEIIFKARWWDYSDRPFNINGRVWLGSSVFFGIGGLCVIKFFNPFLFNVINNINDSFLNIISIILFIILIIDFCISCNIIKKLKLSVYSMKKDYTEEISKKVKLVLIEKSHSFRRLLKAFPDVNFIIKK